MCCFVPEMKGVQKRIDVVMGWKTTLGGVMLRLGRVGARVLNDGAIFAPSIRERQ